MGEVCTSLVSRPHTPFLLPCAVGVRVDMKVRGCVIFFSLLCS